MGAGGPLRHVVLFKFKADATREQIKAVEDAFGKTTLAEVLATPSTSIPLCPFPNIKAKALR